MNFLETILKRSRYQSVKNLPKWLQSTESYSEQIRSLRQLLGMTQAQLAKRASQQERLIRRLETAEETDPQLSTLMKTAQGLGAELIIRFVPKKPIQELLEEQAKKRAEAIIQMSKGSSAMEEQEPSASIVQLQIDKLVEELLQKPSMIWDD